MSNRKPKKALKRIELKAQEEKTAKTIEKEYGVSALLSRVLAARAFVPGNDLENFLNPTLKSGLPSPDKMMNLREGAALIYEIGKNGGKVAICCDFDVDGLSGGSLLHGYLQEIGVQSEVFVPDRFLEGYGLNSSMVERIGKEGYSLLVTVDYGTTNREELKLASELGLKTVVIDHHHVGDHDPGCDVFINPQQSECQFADGTLCAAGLAWYMVVALRAEVGEESSVDPRSFLDLAALGTICDMVPLVGPNRVIAKKGLELLSSTTRLGLNALKNIIGINGEVQGSHVGFGFGPRINAAGRMRHGSIVVELLTTKDRKKADALAKRLNRLNLERQDTEKRIKDAAVSRVMKMERDPNGIVVWDEEFHTGVIGIVAQRMVEIFYKPAAILGADEDYFKGSVRGVKGFDVIEALSNLSPYLLKFGGHKGAGGFSLEKERVEEFAEAFDQECVRQLEGSDSDPVVEADTYSTLEELDLDIVQELKGFAPCGIGNPNPLVLVQGLRVVSVDVLKNMHLKVVLADGKRYVSALMWRQNEHPALIVNNIVDIVCKPDINDFMGARELQLNLQAIEPH